MLRETTNAASTSERAKGARSDSAKHEAAVRRGRRKKNVKEDDEKESRKNNHVAIEEEPGERLEINKVVDEVVEEWFSSPSFDSLRAESERGCGVALDALYQTPLRRMSKQDLLDEKAELKKRLRAYDARVLKVHQRITTKADKRHVRPLYARLAKIKKETELRETKEGMRSLPNLTAAIRV